MSERTALINPDGSSADDADELSPREAKAVQHYVHDEECFGNMRKAAIAAGYSPHSSGITRVFSRPRVKRAVLEALQGAARVCGVAERNDIRSKIARDEDVPPNIRLQALNDLEKAFGAFEKVQLDVRGDVRFASMSLVELRKLAMADPTELLGGDGDDKG